MKHLSSFFGAVFKIKFQVYILLSQHISIHTNLKGLSSFMWLVATICDNAGLNDKDGSGYLQNKVPQHTFISHFTFSGVSGSNVSFMIELI